MEHIAVCALGEISYRDAWALQEEVQQGLISAKRATPSEDLSHALLLVEHPPVFTLGKSGDPENLRLSELHLATRGAEFIKVDRGGDITFHGPGQIVGYPILDLDRFFTDIHRYLRELEEVIIATCADYGLSAGRVDGRTGVWIGPDAQGPERKICALGIRCSRWVTMHGFAFNINTDLSWFDLIVPCGIPDRGVTSLAKELGRELDTAEVTTRLVAHFVERFSVATSVYENEDAYAYLEAFPAPPTRETILRREP